MLASSARSAEVLDSGRCPLQRLASAIGTPGLLRGERNGSAGTWVPSWLRDRGLGGGRGRTLKSSSGVPPPLLGLPLPSSLPPFSFSCPRKTHLAEALESVCEWLLQYSIHTECPGSLRYAKVSRFPPAARAAGPGFPPWRLRPSQPLPQGQSQSQTMSTLRNLVHKGVKVDRGVPPRAVG